MYPNRNCPKKHPISAPETNKIRKVHVISDWVVGLTEKPRISNAKGDCWSHQAGVAAIVGYVAPSLKNVINKGNGSCAKRCQVIPTRRH